MHNLYDCAVVQLIVILHQFAMQCFSCNFALFCKVPRRFAHRQPAQGQTKKPSHYHLRQIIQTFKQITLEIIGMGNAENRSMYRPKKEFDIKEWSQIECNVFQQNRNMGKYISYKHCITGQQIDKYELTFLSKKEERNYHQCYLQRLREDYIVNTVEYQSTNLQQFCSTMYRCSIYIQHIPIRLNNITDIPYPQNIYILRNSLLGFFQLYKNTGYFRVHQSLICIDNFGEVKVWMNQDLSLNYPSDFSDSSSHQSESKMVNEIIELIEINTDVSSCPVKITEFFWSRNLRFPTFREAIRMVHVFIAENKVKLPYYCQSVMEIFRDFQEGNYGVNTPQNILMSLQGEVGGGEVGERGVGGVEKGGQEKREVEVAEDGRKQQEIRNGRRMNEMEKRQQEKQVETILIPKLELNSDNIDKPEKEWREWRKTIKKQVISSQYYPMSSTQRTNHIGHTVNIHRSKNEETSVAYEQNISYSKKVDQTMRLNVNAINKAITQTASFKPLVKFVYTSNPAPNPFKVRFLPNLMHLKQLCKYTTGAGSEDIDPEIAADLLQYL